MFAPQCHRSERTWAGAPSPHHCAPKLFRSSRRTSGHFGPASGRARLASRAGKDRCGSYPLHRPFWVEGPRTRPTNALSTETANPPKLFRALRQIVVAVAARPGELLAGVDQSDSLDSGRSPIILMPAPSRSFSMRMSLSFGLSLNPHRGTDTIYLSRCFRAMPGWRLSRLRSV